jgi:hypothetical protein
MLTTPLLPPVVIRLVIECFDDDNAQLEWPELNVDWDESLESVHTRVAHRVTEYLARSADDVSDTPDTSATSATSVTPDTWDTPATSAADSASDTMRTSAAFGVRPRRIADRSVIYFWNGVRVRDHTTPFKELQWKRTILNTLHVVYVIPTRHETTCF